MNNNATHQPQRLTAFNTEVRKTNTQKQRNELSTRSETRINKQANGVTVYSEYKETPATEQEQVAQFARLIACFPLLTPAWQMEFYRAVKRHKLCGRRLADAVSHIIDTCNFQAPRIAEIINFDKGVRLYTHREVADKVNPGWSESQINDFWNQWPVVQIEGEFFRVSMAELCEKGLKVENKTIFRSSK